jgi:hypothetical protein
MSKKRKKHNLHLNLSPQAHERMQRLVVKADASSFTEVIRRALAVYEDYLDGSVAWRRPPVAPEESGE